MKTRWNLVRAKALPRWAGLLALVLAAPGARAALENQLIGFQDVHVYFNTAPPGGMVTNLGQQVSVPVGEGTSFHWAPSLLSPWGTGGSGNNVTVSGSRLGFSFSDAGFYQFSGRYVAFEGFSIYGIAPSSLGIASLSVAPETTMEGFGVSFEPNRITVDLTGVMFSVDPTQIHPGTGELLYPPRTIVLDVGFTVVPEPSMWGMAVLGAAALMVARRRR